MKRNQLGVEITDKSTQCMLFTHLPKTGNDTNKDQFIKPQIVKKFTHNSTQCKISKKSTTVEDKNLQIGTPWGNISDKQIQVKPILISTASQMSEPSTISQASQTDALTNKISTKTQVCINAPNTRDAWPADTGYTNLLFTPKQMLLPANIVKLINLVEQYYPSLFIAIMEDRVEVTKRGWTNMPFPGATPCKLLVNFNGDCYVLTILNSEKMTFHITCEDKLQQTLDDLSARGKYIFCPGIANVTGCERRLSLVKISYPYTRMQSTKCLQWYKAPQNMSKLITESGKAQCKFCAAEEREIRQLRQSTTPEQKATRIKVNSRCPLKCLSPRSLKSRHLLMSTSRRLQRQKINRLLARLRAHDVNLGLKQHLEMATIVHILSNQFKDDIETALDMISDDNIRKMVRTAWTRDKNSYQQDKIALDENNKQCGKNSTGNRWSALTMRLALAVYHRSPSAYRCLKDFGLLNLPSVRQVQRKAKIFDTGCGISNAQLLQETARYDEHISQRCFAGAKKPLKTGILIFDEVKVVSKLVWNSKSEEFLGLAMDTCDIPFLGDLSQEMSNDKKISPANYVLQFIWRDMTSKFDILGPHFSLEKCVNSKVLYGCVMSTLLALQNHGFFVTAIVCDGASSNLQLIAQMTEMHSVKERGLNRTINPWFLNPHDPPPGLIKIFWIICPSHQLKNMISALHSSKKGGTRVFQRNNFEFGWNHIQDMYNREQNRSRHGHIRMVKGLKHDYIKRDPWTKLNVTPSRIMQQKNVLQELLHYATPDNAAKPLDSGNVMESRNYLKACACIFEDGFFVKEPIFDTSCKVISNIQSGLNFFQTWLDELEDLSSDRASPSRGAKTFLSWQTYSLLRICILGFSGFAQQFFHLYPGYFISPIRVSGSAIETVFSEMKWATGGKLSSVNYKSAKKCTRVKKIVRNVHPSNLNYRDTEINFN